MPLATVALECGFADQSHFTRRFKGSVGVTPAAWRRMG
jgi:AraC-like DNA-binding protein